MAEQVFKSPGFFEKEVDLSQRTSEITGVPAGVIGTADIGPAFVPVTVGSMADFNARFGNLSPDVFGPYAVNEFLKNRTAITYVRVLGAGANRTETDIGNTDASGIVKSAGFIIEGAAETFSEPLKRNPGDVMFLTAVHTVPTDYEIAGYPIYTDNRTFGLSSGGDVNLVRGMIFTTSGSRIEVLNGNASYNPTGEPTTDDVAFITAYDGSTIEGTFKLVVSSSTQGSSFANDEGHAGIKIYTASLDPANVNYIGKILNTDPDDFLKAQHLLYADFPVESEVAKVKKSTTVPYVGILSGSSKSSKSSPISQTYEKAYGRFDTRYCESRTTSFISQPFGNTEYDLFHFETISDGSAANTKFKVSVSEIQRSADARNPYGTFAIQVRDFADTDRNIRILERYPNCNLNPADENYIAKKIGDMKVFYNFDATTDSERRLVVEGKNPNKSQYIRVVMNPAFDQPGNIPDSTLPFGFRGIPVLKTTQTLTDTPLITLPAGSLQTDNNDRLFGNTTTATRILTASVVPPLPLRFKVTKGSVKASAAPIFTGQPGDSETADANLYWGVKFERLPLTGSMTNAILNSNASSDPNPLISSYAKFLGIQKLDTLVTGSGADQFNDNKFTLARVALFNEIAAGTTIDSAVVSELTGSAGEHMLQAAYLRDKDPDFSNYTLLDGTLNRMSMATLAAATSHSYFNKFSNYLKYTNMFYGGFDGNNLLDKDMRLMNDRASSSTAGGKAAAGYLGNLSANYSPGAGPDNNTVFAYRTAAKIILDPMASRINILAIPGIRDADVTDHTADLAREYGQAIYLMDIPSYDSTGTGTRLYDDSTQKPNVSNTAEQFDSRAIDNNFVATYFPDVRILDQANNSMVVGVPASVVAMGALGYNDSVAYPWFAPAGFNRGALEDVRNTAVRLTAGDRDDLYQLRINPIANFPNGGFVIFGQKTLQQAVTALDRVNVRRMLLEVKRLIVNVANKLVFEQNTPATRARFVAQSTPLLSVVQSQQGIDQFKIIMDSSNNTPSDIEENRLNGRIVLVPTRAVEFIAIDFIITNSGVSFE
jgi:hypothetical protein